MALALETGASILLLDDAEARVTAESLGLGVLGTVGILERGARSGLLNFAASFAELEKTNFHISASFRQLIHELYKLES